MGLLASKELVAWYRTWCPSLTAFLERSNLDGTARSVCWACGIAALLSLYLFICGCGSDVRRHRNILFVV